MAKIRCARLDERGVFQGMVEIEEAEAGPLHVRAISSCDLPAGEFRWQPDEHNPFGGAFVPLPRPQRAKAGRPSLEHAVAFDLLRRHAGGDELSDVTLAWLDDALQSVDFVGLLELPLIQAYARARNLPFANAKD
jgi:hypothetical protein